jgi:hypothetical protein
VEAQDAQAYDEPPGWYYPVRESLGAALLKSGRAAEAEAVFRADLKRNPRNGWSLFGLLESLRSQKKDADARWVQREFDGGWKDSPIRLRIGDLVALLYRRQSWRQARFQAGFVLRVVNQKSRPESRLAAKTGGGTGVRLTFRLQRSIDRYRRLRAFCRRYYGELHIV